jgi:site-specific DNA-methyltransferase (adenine-specific)
MKPELNKIYTGDCLEIMRQWPDECFDIVLMDPPYGMSYQSNRYKDGNPFKPIEGDGHYPLEALQQAFRLARNAVFTFCRWNNLKELPIPKSFIVWAKNNWTAGDLEHEFGRSWEGVAFYAMDRHSWRHGRPSDVYDFRRVPPTALEHPTEKPIAILDRLLDSTLGDTVLDPFCGTGPTWVAAYRLGMSFTGVEINPDYVKIAEERIARERAQLKLPL